MKNPCQKLHRYVVFNFFGAFYGGFEVPTKIEGKMIIVNFNTGPAVGKIFHEY